jgi:hypothetical protein
MGFFARLGALASLIGLFGPAGCASPPLMCASPVDCPAKANCAAGRCVAAGATPAINTARRFVFAPRDVAYLRRGEEPGNVPAVARLGGGDGGVVLLRFEATLPPLASVLEAYIVLRPESEADDDPGSVALHAARIADPWRGADVSWAHQPRIVDVGAPTTRVVPAALAPSAFVRLDVRDLVSHWRLRERDDFGIAVLAEGATRTSGQGGGIGFALLPAVPAEPDDDRGPSLALGRDSERESQPGGADWEEIRPSSSRGRGRGVGPSASFVRAGSRGPTGPVLELYVKLM